MMAIRAKDRYNQYHAHEIGYQPLKRKFIGIPFEIVCVFISIVIIYIILKLFFFGKTLKPLSE